MIKDDVTPARVPDAVINAIRAREINGLINLPKQGLRRGDKVRILRGPFQDHVAIYADTKPRERVAVLLALLGSTRPVELACADVELAETR